MTAHIEEVNQAETGPVRRHTHWRHRSDVQAAVLVPALALIALPLTGDLNAWLTLTTAGLAMGMMIFIMTSGFTLVFGLMDVLNFGHGAFISLGAFFGFSVLLSLESWRVVDSIWLNLAAFGLAALVAMICAGLLSWGFERVLVRRVYGNHLMQILITMGGLIVAEQMIYVFWGAHEIPMLKPTAFQGGLEFGGMVFEKYRLLAVVLGALLFTGLMLVFKKTRLGLLIRAGVENREMVESFGYNVRLLFVLVFMSGSALAALGGVMWGLYDEVITAHLGQGIMITVFIVAIIGGLGSIEGCFIAALMVGLLSNYVGFLAPKLALISTIGLLVAVLLWRPQGLVPVAKGGH